MKAQTIGRANPGSRPDPPFPTLDDPGPDDALVMVLFPRASWDAVLALAADMGVPPAEALGAALLLLRKRVDEGS